jgi:hypothetical protein
MPIEQTETKKDPSTINRYHIFSTAVGNALGQAAVFSVGAAVRDQPVRKGAITALAGGTIVGAIVGLLGMLLGVKQKNSTFNMLLVSFVLEEALTFATMPLGAAVVPYEQNLSTSVLIEDQLVGVAVIASPVLFVCFVALCCAAGLAASDSNVRKAMIEQLRQQFTIAELAFVLAEASLTDVPEAPVIVDVEQGRERGISNNYAAPSATVISGLSATPIAIAEVESPSDYESSSFKR